MKYKYHYFYKVTNNINGHFYYGVHNTNNLNDDYMGSGTRLQYAFKKYGIENFSREILKLFSTSKEAFEYEAEIVTEDLVKDNNCYNQKLGGEYDYITMRNTISVIDKDGNTFRVHKDDPRWLSGELKGVTSGKVNAIDSKGNHIFVFKDDPRFETGELQHLYKNTVFVKDKHNNCYHVSKNDPRILSGELIYYSSGKKMSEQAKQKFRETIKNNKNNYKTRTVYKENEVIRVSNNDLQKYLDMGYKIGKGEKVKIIKNQKIYEAHQKYHYSAGEKNSQYGTCWVYNDNESIKIKKEQLEEYISNGWIKGRKMKF